MFETLCKAYVWELTFPENAHFVFSSQETHCWLCATCVRDPENLSLRLNLQPGCLCRSDVVIKLLETKRGTNSHNW